MIQAKVIIFDLSNNKILILNIGILELAEFISEIE
jgi:hypothetical protein